MSDPIQFYQVLLDGRRKRMPDGFWENHDHCRTILEHLWQTNCIEVGAVPLVCTLGWFRAHRLAGMLWRYGQSHVQALLSLYPTRYRPEDFPGKARRPVRRTPGPPAAAPPPSPAVAAYLASRERATKGRRLSPGFWLEPGNCRAVLEECWRQDGIAPGDAPALCPIRWFRKHRLMPMLKHYRDSPWLLLTTLYPGRYRPQDFEQMPTAPDLQRQAFDQAGVPWSETPAERDRRRMIYHAQRRERDLFVERFTATRQEGKDLPDTWKNRAFARVVLEHVLGVAGFGLADAPRVCRRRWLEAQGLGALLQHHGHSPARMLATLWPERFGES